MKFTAWTKAKLQWVFSDKTLGLLWVSPILLFNILYIVNLMKTFYSGK